MICPQGFNFISDSISTIPCSNCGGRVQEFSVANELWNKVVRKNGKETNREYLCIWCFASLMVYFLDNRT
jgi:DNA-directed RNA polymerase subunit RPC12/RpoP